MLHLAYLTVGGTFAVLGAWAGYALGIIVVHKIMVEAARRATG